MRTTADPIQAHRFFSFLRKTLGAYLVRISKTKVVKENTFKPPYVLLGNHINSFDPFVLAAFVDHPTLDKITLSFYFKDYTSEQTLDKFENFLKEQGLKYLEEIYLSIILQNY